MTAQSSSLNIAKLMTRKQLNNPVTMKNREKYWKELSRTFQIKKGGKIIKVITFTFNQTYNHNSIRIIDM